MESLASLYKNHIATLQERTRDALARFKLDALLIHSGELFNVFLDDHPYPFKVNPQFKAWVPVTQVPNCWLLVDGCLQWAMQPLQTNCLTCNTPCVQATPWKPSPSAT